MVIGYTCRAGRYSIVMFVWRDLQFFVFASQSAILIDELICLLFSCPTPLKCRETSSRKSN